MPRKPKIRASYTSDASFLVRLSVAVEADTKRPLKWRKEVMGLIQQLSTQLLRAPDVKASRAK